MKPNHKRILLVEDDITLAGLYAMRFEAEGFTVKHCDNGETALGVAKEFMPDLILLDIMMPRLNGFDVLDILQNTPETKMIRVMVLSAMSQPADQQRALELGAVDYLVKSQVVLADVVKRVREILDVPAEG